MAEATLSKSEQEIVEHLEYLTKSLDVEDVEIRLQSNPHGKTFEIFVPKHERGKIIGKDGRNITSVRTLTNAFAKVRGVHASVHVNEN